MEEIFLAITRVTIDDARGQGNEPVTVRDQTTEISLGYANVFK